MPWTSCILYKIQHLHRPKWHPDDSYIQPTVHHQLINTFNKAQGATSEIANNRVNGLSVIWKQFICRWLLASTSKAMSFVCVGCIWPEKKPCLFHLWSNRTRQQWQIRKWSFYWELDAWQHTCTQSSCSTSPQYMQTPDDMQSARCFTRRKHVCRESVKLVSAGMCEPSRTETHAISLVRKLWLWVREGCAEYRAGLISSFAYVP